MNKETTKRVVVLSDEEIEAVRGALVHALNDRDFTASQARPLHVQADDNLRAALDQPQGEERAKRRKLILVCGSRDWFDAPAGARTLELQSRLSQQDVLSAIVLHGGADGADSMAENVCLFHNVHTAVVKPRWRGFGKRAGYLRNCAMLDLQPDLVIAFSTGSRGTQHTINEARKRGIPVEVHGTERQDIDQQEGGGT